MRPTVTFGMTALFGGPGDNHTFMLYCLEKHGVEIRCWSTLDHAKTKAMLAEAGWLGYFDDILWQRPEDGVVVEEPALATYTAIADSLNLPREPLLALLDRALTSRVIFNSAGTIQPERSHAAKQEPEDVLHPDGAYAGRQEADAQTAQEGQGQVA